VPQEIDRNELQRLVAEGAQVIEVLPSPEYEEDHLPGSIHIPLKRIDATATQSLDRRRPVIVYCWDSA